MMDYDKIISSKCKKLKPSGIRKFFDVASMMEGVISLGVGEPDFLTPWTIRKSAIDVLERGKTTYTANSGLMELREEIGKYLKRTQNIDYNPKTEIVITVGGSEAIDVAIRSIISPLDEVLVVEPCFVCYAPIVELTGGVAIPLVTKVENNFKLTAKEIEEKITDKTKLIIMPFPNNPTGAVMTKEDYQPIVELLKDKNIMVLSDEIYAELTYTGKPHCSIASFEEMKDKTILVNGFSKAYAMTGWRLGYLAGPAPLVEQMLKIHQYAIMCSPTVSQHAAIEALQNCDSEVKRMADEYNIRRRWLVNALNEIGLDCFEPEGAFYVFPSIKSTGLTSEVFCEKLLYEHKVAVVPGNAFGECGEGYIRISYAYSMKHLKEAVTRIKEFVDELKK